jgi:KRAB domain-containing zinc finger protein
MLGFSKSTVGVNVRLFKKFTCEKCGKKFKQREELMQHQQVTHGTSTYDCKQCNLYFSSMEEMRTHLQRAHSYRGKKDS